MFFNRLALAALAVFAVVRAEEEDDWETDETTVENAAEEDEISMESIEKQIREDFNSMDTDKDNLIDRAELVAYLNDASLESEVDEFFGKADVDKDSKVTFEEYKSFVMELIAQMQAEDDPLAGFDEKIAEINAQYDMGEDDWEDDEEHLPHHLEEEEAREEL